MLTGHLAPVFWIVSAQAHKEIGGQVSPCLYFCFMRIARLISLPGGTILREKTNERECWKFLDQRFISENDSCLNGQPSNAISLLIDRSIILW